MASTYLYRSPSSAGSNTTWTFSFWLKRSAIGLDTVPWATGYTSPQIDESMINLGADDQLRFNIAINDSTDVTVKSSRKLRDTSAWYHIVVACDTTQSTASNRIKFYINGEQETNLSLTDYPTQNQSTFFGDTNKTHQIGRQPRSSNYLDGYMNDVAFVDGQALAPTVFGETDSTSGIWKWKDFTGVTWGTNGFHLKMGNSTNLGLDSSGKTNNFTLSGNGRQAKDTPTNVRATLNPLVTYGTNQNALTEGNNTLTGIAYHRPSPPTIAVNKGKWYFEAKALSGTATKWWIGLCDTEYDTLNQGAISSSANYIWGYDNTTNAVNQRSQCIYANNLRGGGSIISISNIFSAGAIAVNDIYAMAVDLDNQKVWYSKNGVWHNGSASESTTWNSSYPDDTNLDADRFYSIGVGGENSKWSTNFGNGYFGTTAITSAGSNGNGSLFEYDVPSGYYALNTKNINTYG